MSVRVTSLGGTSRIGRHVVKQLLDAGHEVVALVRTPGKLAVQHPSLTAYLADVSARHLPKVERMRLRVDQRLSQESRRLANEAMDAREQEEKGIKPRESSDSLWHKAQDLQARREARLALLEKQAQLGTSPPRIVTAALVLPLSLVETEIPSDSPIHATEKVALKRRGIDLVLAAERELGREPQVQACGYPGYDIASFPHNGGASIRIVVKAHLEGADDFYVSHNEIITSRNAAPQYRLALVTVSQAGPEYDQVRYVADPFADVNLGDLTTPGIRVSWPRIWALGTAPF